MKPRYQPRFRLGTTPPSFAGESDTGAVWIRRPPEKEKAAVNRTAFFKNRVQIQFRIRGEAVLIGKTPFHRCMANRSAGAPQALSAGYEKIRPRGVSSFPLGKTSSHSGTFDTKAPSHLCPANRINGRRGIRRMSEKSAVPHLGKALFSSLSCKSAGRRSCRPETLPAGQSGLAFRLSHALVQNLFHKRCAQTVSVRHL